MRDFVPWNSQPLEAWAARHATGEFVDLAGRRTHFLARGEGPPLVLIHGFNFDSCTWIRNLDSLASQFKVYAPDLWGQGFSTREPLNYGYDLFAEQIRLFMDKLEIPRASLVGHSMGGGTSVVFALRHRERVHKLVLLDAAGLPTTLPFRARLFRLKGVAEFLLSLPGDKVRRRNLEDVWIQDRASLTAKLFEAFTLAQKIEGSTEALLTILRKDFFNTLEDEVRKLGGLEIPVLIVWGREDRSLPLHCGKAWHRLVPGSRFEVLDDAGHLANFDRADAFNELVATFLAVER